MKKKIRNINYLETIADLTLGTGHHNLIIFNVFYINTIFLLILWKYLTDLFQKQVKLLKKSIFGEVRRERNNWPLGIQYMDTWHDGFFLT